MAFAQTALLTLFLMLASCMFALSAAPYDLGFGENVDFLFFVFSFFVCMFLFLYFALKVLHLFWRSLNHSLRPEAAVYSDGRLNRGRNTGSRTRQIRM